MTEPWWRDAAPARRRSVSGGIQIASTRGQVARTWWSSRFLHVCESIGVGGRLARGRTYARQGQIVTLDVAPGAVTAAVQGTRPRPYAVRIGLQAFGKAEWARVLDELAGDASFTAALLNGELPHEIEDVFDRAGLALFPATAREVSMDCTCPDVTVPCKHLAAVFYVLAERFDADPFTILALRGRDRDTVLAELRERRNATADGRPAEGASVPLSTTLEHFFELGAAPGLDGAVPLRGPDVPADALLDQVPEFPLALPGTTLTELLRPAYRALGADQPPARAPR